MLAEGRKGQRRQMIPPGFHAAVLLYRGRGDRKLYNPYLGKEIPDNE